MKEQFAAFILLSFLLPISAYAHEETENAGLINNFSPIAGVLYASLIMSIVILISIFFRKKLNNRHKKTLFLAMVISIVFSTIYLAASTVYLNTISESKGPVHWHADFEVWICGQKVLLKEPEGLDNKVGSPVLHHHNEGKDLDGRYRIHVEGVLVKLSEASLRHFFEETGNYLIQDSIGLFLQDGSQKRWFNGDVCPNTDKKGTLKVFVNDKQIENFTEYVISPYSNVPPGDFIKIVFE